MKNYNEMANDVLRRIGEHETEQRNKRKKVKRIIIPICCACLVVLLGIGLWQGDFFNSKPPITLDDSTIIGEKDTIDDKDDSGVNDDTDGDWSPIGQEAPPNSSNNSATSEDRETIDEDCSVEDNSSEYTVSNTVIDSAKAEKTKFEVSMTVNISTVNEYGVATMNKTTKIPLNSNNITLEIINNNDEIFIVCSGFWRLEKFENGEYKEVATSNYEASSSCGPNNSCFVFCELNKYSNQISEGKYRIISPTLNIAKETENGLKDYIYQNEKAFILYSDFEFVQ